MYLKNRLKEILEARTPRMSQKELAEITGLRENAISDLVNNSRTTINREHIGRVAKALGISSVNDILYFDEHR